MKLFVDFTDKSQFETKFHTELSPRLLVSHHVPREVNREHLTRIAWLGDGHFGEVWQHAVDDPFSHVPPCPVAAKTLKTDQAVGDAREVLLKEASMSASFEHRNVVKLVGVVTIPRDVSVLILFEFCANGRLDTCIRERGSITIGAPMILTFCAEVICGLDCVAGLRVIHRDVALRNVLLDSLGICKLSDFGAACGLGDEVCRPLNQLPLPWASVELLQAGPSFSVHSDAWAAGVLTWEAFSDAAVPHRSDVDNLAELADFVEQGGRLVAPPTDICPSDVFEKLLKPCWATDLGNRPDFGELHSIAVMHGAQEDDQALEERRDQAFEERRARQANASTRRSMRGGKTRSDRTLDCPSVEFMSRSLLPELVVACMPHVVSDPANLDPFTLRNVSDASSHQLKDFGVLPQTLDLICTRDQQRGAVCIDVVAKAEKGTASAILSCAWKHPFSSVVGAVTDWCLKNKLNPAKEHVWTDVLCWSQHGRLGDPTGEWEARVAVVGQQLTTLHPWNDPIYTTRAWARPAPKKRIFPLHVGHRISHHPPPLGWASVVGSVAHAALSPCAMLLFGIVFGVVAQCVFELCCAIGLGVDQCELEIILAPEDRAAFDAAVNQKGHSVVDDALANIHAESAEAFSSTDLAAIRAKVTSHAGGFDAFNSVVKTHLQRWFVAQGSMRTVARRIGANLTTSGGAPLPQRSVSNPPTIEVDKAGRAAAVADGGAGAKQPENSDGVRFLDDLHGDSSDNDSDGVSWLWNGTEPVTINQSPFTSGGHPGGRGLARVGVPPHSGSERDLHRD